MSTLNDIAELLRKPSKSLVCTHVSPDPDAIGSAGGLCHLLLSLGVDAALYLPEGLSETFRKLLVGIKVVEAIDEFEYERIVAVDTASAPRLGPCSADLLSSTKEIINIDHHGSNTLYGSDNFIDAKAASSTVIVFRLYQELGLELSPAAANLLFAGLMDDTGSFRYSNTNVESFNVAASLLSAGANPESLANALYFSVPERVLRLKARAVEHLDVELNGKLAIIAVSDELMTSCGAMPGETEGIVDIARSVEGVVAAAFIREAEGGWKASLRAKDTDLDVNKIAASFGGGGHKAAAGCKLEGSFEEVKAALLKEFEQALLALEA